MQVSVIIPTYNRAKDVDECLDSIIIQTKLPKETLIVDDSSNDEVENLIEHRKYEFKEKNIILRYIRNVREKSLTIARNVGVENAAGDIILFLDSDVVLDEHYIEELLKVYVEKPIALGVQGFICVKRRKGIMPRFAKLFDKLFYITLDDRSRCRVLPSLGVTDPFSPPDKVINCEWLSGANHSYKKEILEEFRWDENLKKYSWGEDLDLPYRVFKKCPGSLFMTPHAKLIHKASQEGRHLTREVVYMDVVYLTYLFYKNIDQTFKNKLIYIWSRIGRTIKNILLLAYNSELTFTNVKYTLGAPFYCMRHIKEIKRGDLEFFNKELG